MMDFTNVTKIEVITDHKTANLYIEAGWELALIYATLYPGPTKYTYDQVANYVVVWMDGEPKYPKLHDDDSLLSLL